MIIFTECYNCAEVAKYSIESFFKWHPDRILNVMGFKEDCDYLKENITVPSDAAIIYSNDPKEGGRFVSFQSCHDGTAKIFASFFHRGIARVVHFDSDLIFKKEIMSTIELALAVENTGVIGSRRCYGNNPVNITGLTDYPDTMSTYLIGINTEFISEHDSDTLIKMWRGAYHPLGYPVLDFGDGVVHEIIHNGGAADFIDFDIIGGQNKYGKKTNKYISNLHMDMGSHVLHFGGVGSGCSIYHGRTIADASYAKWAIQRYAVFKKVMENQEEIIPNESPVYDADGRWISGGFDDALIEQIRTDLNN